MVSYSRQRWHRWFLRGLLAIFALNCSACAGTTVPDTVKETMKSDDVTVLRRMRLKDLIRGYDSSLVLVVVEGTSDDGLREHGAYLARGRREVYPLGPLRPMLDGAPVELLFFQIGDDRFAVVWVDESIEGQLETVTLGRPEMLATDDSMRVLRVGAVDHRVAVLPFFSDEIDLWDQINLLLIGTRQIGFAWDQTFDPPVDIRDQVLHVPTP